MYCLWCDEEMIPEMTWTNIVLLAKQKQLCASCEKELILLQGQRCHTCSRKSLNEECTDCKHWKQRKNGDDVLTFNYSVYAYNDRIQEMLAKWKYRGDYILGDIFKAQFVQSFKRHFSFLTEEIGIAPIPLSEQRMRERRFNQAEVLANFLPINHKIKLTRIHSEKQAKKTRYERISSDNPFRLTKKVNKPVILVDDIYTTGTTVRHAAALLKEKGCPTVYAYTLIRG